MKKLLLPLLILSLSLSLIACGGEDEPGETTTGTQGTGNTTVTLPSGPIGPTTPVETVNEAAAYELGDFVSYAEDDNFTYKVYQNGAAVSGFKGNGEATVPEKIDSADIKVIGKDAFRGVTNLTKITIPDSVSLIAKNAFYQCTGLTEVSVPAGCTVEEKAFAYATGLTSATIAENAVLGTGIFYGCTALTSCTLPAPMTVIPAQTFYGCSALKYSIPSNITEIGDEAFFSCTSLTEIVIPDGLHRIGNSAFYNCTGVTELTLPGTVSDTTDDTASDTADDNAENTPAEASVIALAAELEEDAEGETPDESETPAEGETPDEGETPAEGENPEEGEEGGEEAPGSAEAEPSEPAIPAEPANGLVYIGDYAFYNLKSVTSVQIPDTVVYIGTFAFSGTGIKAIEIPTINPSASYNFEGIGTVNSQIGAGAFAGCLGLTEITIPDTLTTIPDLIVYGCENITAIHYNPEITRIGMGSFAKTAITSLHIPETVTALGVSAFEGCVNLADLDIGPTITNISASAFKGCTALTEITIPVQITTIGESAFSGCTALTQVVFADDSINTIFGRECFYNCPGLMSIVIPASCNQVFNANCFGYIEDPNAEGTAIPLEGFKMTGYIGGTFETYAKTYSANLTAYLQSTNPEEYGEDAEPVEDFLTIVGMVGCSPYAEFQWDMLEPTATPAAAAETAEAAPTSDAATAPSTPAQENTAPVGLILKKYTGSSENVVIPTAFRLNENKEISLYGIDRRVVVIGSSAFEGNTAIKSVTIPNSVEMIEANAFKDCTNLSAADMRNLTALDSVGDNAFLNTSLFTVYLPNTLKADNIGEHAFCYVLGADGNPTVAEVAFYQYKATEYSRTDEGEIEVDEEGNSVTVENTYATEAEVPSDAISVERVPVPPTIYCNGTGGSTYAQNNGIESASIPAA